VCATLCVPIPAQTPAPSGQAAPAANASSPQLEASADAVSIDLVVHDKRKRPVLDLVSSDIAVSDAGNPVQLSNLHLVTAASGGGATIDLVFDRMGPESVKIARDIADKLLSMAPGKASFAVFGLDRGLRLLQNFTPDRAAIQAAAGLALGDLPGRDLTQAEKQLLSVEQTGTLPSGSSASLEDRAMAHLMLSALEESQRTVQEQHAPPALAGLQALAEAQRKIPGRKVVIFFSGGLRTNSNTENLAREVVETASRAGIAIYTIDTNAVDAQSFDVLTMMYASSLAGTVRNTPSVSGMVPSSVRTVQSMATFAGSLSDAKSINTLDSDRRESEGNALAFLANGSGGFSISAGDNLREPLQRLAGDIANYYEASYTPELKDYDGQFHSLDIKPLREGVTIRSRAGYFSLPPDAAGAFTVRPYESPLLKTLSESALPSDVKFQQAVLRLGGSGPRTANELAIEVPLANVELHRDQQTLLYSAHFSILAQIKDKAGVVIERFSEDVSRSGALETIEAARASSAMLQRHFTAAPGSYVLEAAVLDRLSEKSGAQRTEFTVPGAPDGPWLSDIAMVERSEAFTGAPDPLEPLQYAKARVVPNLSLQAPQGTPRITFFFRIHPDPSLANRDGKLDVDVQRDGQSVSHSSMNVAHSPGSDSSVNLATIESKAFSPGSYLAVFTYTQGDKSCSRNVSFTVDGSRTAGVVSPPEPTDDPTGDDANAPAGAAIAPAELPDLAAGRFAPAPGSGISRPPAKAYQDSLLASARERAVGYIDALVNFKCIEVTDRFFDLKGTGSWTRHDKIAEMVTFENHEESREILAVNGQPGNTQPVSMKGARLEGEFGGVLKAVFDLSSKAEFEWKETDSLDGAAVQVLSYRVDEKNSKFSVTALPALPRFVAFHGLVYIDEATRGVRRITMEAEGIPADSPIHASAVTIDYDYVAINNHDYLMPVRGEMRMKLGKDKGILHRIEFRDYHRFGSAARIVGFNPQ
jgi:VWFA-related protein